MPYIPYSLLLICVEVISFESFLSVSFESFLSVLCAVQFISINDFVLKFESHVCYYKSSLGFFIFPEKVLKKLHILQGANLYCETLRREREREEKRSIIFSFSEFTFYFFYWFKLLQYYLKYSLINIII